MGRSVDNRIDPPRSTSHEARPQRLLEGGDRRVRGGKGDLEMCDDLRRRSSLRRQLRRRAAPRQCRADLALGPVEAFPDPQPGAVAELARRGAERCHDAARRGALEEPPQTARSHTESFDLLRRPDADRSAAAAACLAIAAKDPPCSHRLSLRAPIIKAIQKAMLNQRPDRLAVRTRRQPQPLHDRPPFLGAAITPTFLAHDLPRSRRLRENRDSTGVGKRRGTMDVPEAGCGASQPGRSLPNCRCNHHPPIRCQFGNRSSEMRSERGKGHLAHLGSAPRAIDPYAEANHAARS